MLDAPLRKLIDPPLIRAGKVLANRGIPANAITIAGFVAAMGALVAISREFYLVGLAFIVLNRVLDGLDGAVARQTQVTDLGGYLDIVLDFIFYSAVPFGFALADPGRALASAFLIFSFIATGATFLTYSVFAEKRGLVTTARGRKSIYYIGGITEGTETFIAFALACLFPDSFSVIAYVFGILAFMTAGMRVAVAVESLRTP